MAYTFKTYKSPNDFGPQALDSNKQTIQVASGIQTKDATASPVTSPLTIPSATITTINVPTNASKLHLIPLAHSINISELPGMSNAFTAPSGVEVVIPCVRQAVIYLQANTADAVGSSFYFEII
jgi:hypothetical protein